MAKAIAAVHAAAVSPYDYRVLVRPECLVLMVDAFEQSTRQMFEEACFNAGDYTIEDRSEPVESAV